MNLSVFAKIQKSPTLAHELTEQLRQSIKIGEFKCGDKLPAIQEIEKQTGVSRTVVREAVAQLHAEGLVTSKQGRGIFVIENNTAAKLEIGQFEFFNKSNVISILELRKTVEIESCALAAIHHSAAQLNNIKEALKRLEDKLATQGNTTYEDINLHNAIAAATGNQFIQRFVEFAGTCHLNAEKALFNHNDDTPLENTLIKMINQEHRQIVNAIQKQDPDLAKESMRQHLENSINRL
ncbi:FadR family transcriptional regulator (plasmid) [Saccharobesus litoralis]|uniref:FadR family transcriptional regulator n=1 Tax=Saccharobesus litoralis TaxID=2172099 RepID=A0A2S0VY84_9ALTE|nr:FadR/GntR family transcriptional regulator [Saccharobesus litoralis]AWB69171.1 FadR family transcriptional regulator [Saccharobesus litoralis]